MESGSDAPLPSSTTPTATPIISKKLEFLRRADAYEITRSISASMYHSAIDSFLGPQEEVDPVPLDHAASEGTLLQQQQNSLDRSRSLRRRRASSARCRHSSLTSQQKLLVAVERQVHAKLSVMEVQLSLSSRGQCVCVCTCVCVCSARMHCVCACVCDSIARRCSVSANLKPPNGMYFLFFFLSFFSTYTTPVILGRGISLIHC